MPDLNAPARQTTNFDPRVVADRIPLPSADKVVAFLLDKDGTLDPKVPDPMSAVVPKDLAQGLTQLGDHPGISMTILSGRDIPTLTQLCGPLGSSPNVNLVGVHGSQIKIGDQIFNRGVPIEVIETLTTTVRAMPSLLVSFFRAQGLNLRFDAPSSDAPYLEVKPPFSLVLHWRACPHLADPANYSFREFIAEHRSKHPELDVLELHAGDNILELKPSTKKGEAATEIIRQVNPAFIVTGGDDVTDDSMFAAVAESEIPHLIVAVGSRTPTVTPRPGTLLYAPSPKEFGIMLLHYASRVPKNR